MGYGRVRLAHAIWGLALIVVFAAMYFRYRRLDPRLRPSTFYDIALWTSAIAIFAVALIGAKDLIWG